MEVRRFVNADCEMRRRSGRLVSVEAFCRASTISSAIEICAPPQLEHSKFTVKMGKTAPVRNKSSTSVHSRAAKRATSPGINLDTSLKDLKPPARAKQSRPSVLAIHQGAGVSKKSKNGRKSVLSSKARRRQERGLDRAEAVIDKKEKRIEKSKVKARSVQERSKDWDALNKTMLATKAREESLALEKEKENRVEKEVIHGAVEAEDVPVLEAMVLDDLASSIPLPPPAEDSEEIL